MGSRELKTYTCSFCRKAFEDFGDRKYCSMECNNRDRLERQKNFLLPARPPACPPARKQAVKECRFCKARFTGRYGSGFCSADCKKSFETKEKTCLACEEIFVTTLSNQQYCSKACSLKPKVKSEPVSICRCGVAIYTRLKNCSFECNQQSRLKDLGKGFCPICKAAFDVRSSKKRRGQGIYCGLECSQAGRRQKHVHVVDPDA